MPEFLLISIDGRRYAVRKENISSIQGLQHLHRLPLSPAFIAGVSLIGDRTVTIADLAACLGHPALPEHTAVKFAMLPGEQNISGFAFRGEAEPCSIPPDALLPIPPSVKIDFLEECIVHDGLIPVINLERMWSRICRKDQGSADELFTQTAGIDAESPRRIHIVRLGRDLYAIPGAGPDGQPNSDQTVELPLLPPFLKGISLHHGTILPLIDLNEVIYGKDGGKAGCMVPTEIRGERYGLLADEEERVIADPVAFRDLPPIARSALFPSAILQSGSLIPVIDPDAVPAVAQGSTTADPLSKHYTPELQFLSQFMKQDVELVEFLLLGAKHALPKCEVEDVVPLRNYRPIPFAPPIVAGAAEHNGSIIAVLDPGLIFGRRSRVAPDWSMILVKNGDFRALILTEAAVGSRMLPVDGQRTVPILLPHHVVYGCYPDQNSVRLILNIHAIAVHFEQSLVQDLLGAFPGEVQQTLPDIPAVSHVIVSVHDIGTRDADEQPYPEPVDETQPVVQTGQEKTAEAAEQSRPIPVGTAAQSAPAQAAAPSPEEIQGEASAAEAAAVQESLVRDEPAEADAATQGEEEAAIFSLTGEQGAEQDAALSAATVEANETAQDWEAAPGEQRADQPDLFIAAEPAVEKAAGREAEVAVAVSGLPGAPEPQMPVWPLPEQQSDRFSSEIEPPPIRSNRRRMIVVGAVAAMIGLFFYMLPVSKQLAAVKHAVTIPSPDQNLAAMKAPEPKIPEKTSASLVLEIPTDRPTDISIYIVVTGDTLWSISERFTGNPFNYPRIAGENRIADPDMIFPGQKIRLEMKKK